MFRFAAAASIAGATAYNATDGNPFTMNPWWYVNPINQKEYDGSIATASGKVKDNLQKMRGIPSAYWIDNKSKVHGSGTDSVEGILTDAAAKSPPELVVLIFYDLPNRDCDAAASNGEICCTYKADGTCDYDASGDCADGIQEYKTDYVDPFVSVLAKFKGKLPIVLVVEPDSLPNMASNLAHPHCGNPATQAAYKKGIPYALNELATKTDATLYLDAAHGGWLGWSDNMAAYVQLMKDLDFPLSRMRGFATNVANYQPIGEMCPWDPDQDYRNGYCLNNRHPSAACCADPCDLSGQWNPANNELNFAQSLIKTAQGMLNWEAHAIIDTGRNGVADMRQSCENWCNIRGAGAGQASTTDVADPTMIDAYFWLKTPGEGDGCTQTLPDGGQCPRFDTKCGSVDSIGSQSSEPRAPEAGHWFDYQVKQLAENANLGVIPPSPPPSPPTPTPPTPTPPTPPTPTPPSPDCPGGSYSACLSACSTLSGAAFDVCKSVCDADCPQPTPTPPPTPPTPPPTPPTDCPGGSLAACISGCPTTPTVFAACVERCQKQCAPATTTTEAPPSGMCCYEDCATLATCLTDDPCSADADSCSGCSGIWCSSVADFPVV